MQTFKKVNVYEKIPVRGKRGKTGIAFIKKQKGVYKIFENSKLVYVGNSTSDLYKTVLRHFQKWNDYRQKNRISYKDKLSEKTYKVELTVIDQNAEIFSLESILISELQPRDNKIDNYNIYNNKFTAEETACVDCYEESVKPENVLDFEKMSYNESGQLLDENGNVIF